MPDTEPNTTSSEQQSLESYTTKGFSIEQVPDCDTLAIVVDGSEPYGKILLESINKNMIEQLNKASKTMKVIGMPSGNLEFDLSFPLIISSYSITGYFRHPNFGGIVFISVKNVFIDMAVRLLSHLYPNQITYCSDEKDLESSLGPKELEYTLFHLKQDF